MTEPAPSEKPLRWIGSSFRDFCELPRTVQKEMGFALHLAQVGDKHPNAKPLKGFGGAGVLEIVTSKQGDTFRAMYTVRFADAVYVLHAFQKKSKSGRETPKAEMNMVERRLKEAEIIARGGGT